jgi:hypothetical protein
MIRKPTLIVPFVALMASVCAAPQSAAPQSAAPQSAAPQSAAPQSAAPQSAISPLQKGEYNTVQLLQLMDKDRNGKVSRAEFMKFMNDEFDRLDVNKDGELDVNELAELHLHYLRGTSR